MTAFSIPKVAAWNSVVMNMRMMQITQLILRGRNVQWLCYDTPHWESSSLQNNPHSTQMNAFQSPPMWDSMWPCASSMMDSSSSIFTANHDHLNTSILYTNRSEIELDTFHASPTVILISLHRFRSTYNSPKEIIRHWFYLQEWWPFHCKNFGRVWNC